MQDSKAMKSDDLRVALVLAGFKNTQEGHDLAQKSLDSNDPNVANAALSALVRMGKAQEAHFEIAFSKPETAWHASELSIKMPAGEAIDRLLLNNLDGEDPELAEVGAFALGERHETQFDQDATEETPGENTQLIVERLIYHCANHKDKLVRESCVAALGSIGSQLAQSVIIAALGDVATIRRRAVIALAAFEGDEVEAALRGALNDRDYQVRQIAQELCEI